MAREGTHVALDGLNLSWPKGGEREVRSMPPDERSFRIRERILSGFIVEVDDKPTKDPASVVGPHKLLTGEEARKHRAIPAGPVTRMVFDPEKGEAVEVPLRRKAEAEPAAEQAEEKPKKAASRKAKPKTARSRPTRTRAPKVREVAGPGEPDPQASDSPTAANEARGEAAEARLDEA